MKKKIVWMVVISLMALSLVMASCGPAAEEEVEIGEAEVEIEEEEEEVEEEVVEEEVLLPPEVPKYGGWYTVAGTMDPMGFDEAYVIHPNISTCFLTNEELMIGDWAKGPAGTVETDWFYGFVGRVELETGCLAESWEMPDDETIIYHIRKGVHWHNKPPVNGREYTAEDAAWSLERSFMTPTAYLYGAYVRPGYAPTSWTALDKYTLEVKAPELHGLMLLVNGDFAHQYPREMVEQYGDMKDWENSCGTGPFMLTDYVAGSSITYERNPNYWQSDPLHPENQLPYLDGHKTLIIPDLSTRLAALRTAKIDSMSAITWEDAEIIINMIPEMEYKVNISTPAAPVGRMDKEELPFKDIRVRQALNLAVNQQEIIDDYYRGNATLLGLLWPPGPTHEKIYTPLEEMPTEPTIEGSACSVPELFTYNPDKARALLAEAGYPDGFKTNIICSMVHVDFLAMIREYFLDVGVDMEIRPQETGVYTGIYRKRSHEEMLYKGPVEHMFPFRMLSTRIESFDNYAYFEHPRTRACYEVVSSLVGKDDVEVNRQLKEIGPFVLEQALWVWLPAPHTYTIWWPWVQNFYGATMVGYFNPSRYIGYIWYDEAMKEYMGY